MRFYRMLVVGIAALTLVACGDDGSDGAVGPAGPPGNEGPPGPSSVQIQSLTAQPVVVSPGNATVLTVTANAEAGATLTYSWSADEGSFSGVGDNPTTWIAPNATGSYLLKVDVDDGTTITSGYASVLVSVSPSGPIITSVNPTEAKSGETIRLLGAGFGNTQGSSSLQIEGIPVTDITSWNDFEIHATVPTNAVSGNVLVTVAGVDSSTTALVVPWEVENPVNLPITETGTSKGSVTITPDGSDGMFVAWHQMQSMDTGENSVYAQRIDERGNRYWNSAGIAITTNARSQLSPEVVGDGNGGAFIVWQDLRSMPEPAPITIGFRDIYAQHVNSDGVATWPENGVPVIAVAEDQTLPKVISDNAGGIIVVWEDQRSGSQDIYAQRLNSTGDPLWAAGGIVISEGPDSQSDHHVIADGAGGAFIVWGSGVGVARQILVQRLAADGSEMWASGGVIARNANATAPSMAADGNGGIIVVWTDGRNGAGNNDIYGQRFNSDSSEQWTSGGTPVTNASGNQQNAEVVADAEGRAAVVWEDYRNGADSDIYAQRLDADGNAKWTPEGYAVSTAVGNEVRPVAVITSDGEFVITWEDRRSAASFSNIYAQRFNQVGNVLWPLTGLAISTQTGGQTYPKMLPDPFGGATILWYDTRSGNDIYAQGVTAGGRQ